MQTIAKVARRTFPTGWTIEMADTLHLYIFAYDIERDGLRTKVAGILERKLVRVQKSVFEGHMSVRHAKKLADRIGRLVEATDSLRVYCVTEAGIDNSTVIGVPPLGEKQPFMLL